jgi:hypothetical protein
MSETTDHTHPRPWRLGERGVMGTWILDANGEKVALTNRGYPSRHESAYADAVLIVEAVNAEARMREVTEALREMTSRVVVDADEHGHRCAYCYAEGSHPLRTAHKDDCAWVRGATVLERTPSGTS